VEDEVWLTAPRERPRLEILDRVAADARGEEQAAMEPSVGPGEDPTREGRKEAPR
jgi:hypothetical protein